MPPLRSSLHHPFSVLVALLVVPPSIAYAQGAAGCSAATYHQFDFWVGSWMVSTPEGKAAGTSRIEAILGGCVLQEHWQSSNGGGGTSLNMWNAADGKWHQVWMDAGGNMLELSGALEGNAMVLSGTHPTPSKPGTTTMDRITWTPLDGGKVRQLWEASTDSGSTWITAFDGLYARQP